MLIRDVPWELVERCCAGALTPEERAALDVWIGDDPARRLFVERMEMLFADRTPPPDKSDIERAWRRLADKLETDASAAGSSLSASARVLMILAVVAAAAFAAWLFVRERGP